MIPWGLFMTWSWHEPLIQAVKMALHKNIALYINQLCINYRYRYTDKYYLNTADAYSWIKVVQVYVNRFVYTQLSMLLPARGFLPRDLSRSLQLQVPFLIMLYSAGRQTQSCKAGPDLWSRCCHFTVQEKRKKIYHLYQAFIYLSTCTLCDLLQGPR